MKLLDPIDINGMHLDNRVIMLATHLSYCDASGNVNDRVIEFYRERAKYRPGLIVVGGCFMEHFGRSGPTMIGLSYNGHVEGHTKLVNAIHEYDIPVAVQLFHAGRYSNKAFIGDDPVSSSAVPSKLFHSTPRPLTIQEIKGTIDNFGLAAERAIECGYDAVEIIGSSGYLINQFMAKATNKRNDEYNGDLQARARFAIEVVETIREYVGDDYPILYRMSGEDFVPDGTTLKQNNKDARWLEDAGIDCLNVTGGWHETRVPQTTMDVPRGQFAYLAEELADVVNVPVVACNRINSPTIAERILQRGRAELIGLSRGFIADPEFVEKVRTGRNSEIRTCIACNEGCLDRIFRLEPVICAINPQAGYEAERQLGPVGEGAIAVVGGGPAGMEAARVLALRGFTVTLFEKEKRIGGMLNLISRVPLRGEYATYVVHMERELKRLGVTIELGRLVKAEDLLHGDYDHIVIATGTIAGAPPIDGVEELNVITVDHLLSAEPEDLGRVSVIGDSSLACYAALYASSHAKSVDFFFEDRAGSDLGISTRWVIMKALKERGVEFHEDSDISQISTKYVMYRCGDTFSVVDTDLVIVSDEPEPRTRLLEKLRMSGIPISDTVSPTASSGKVSLIGSAKGYKTLLECVHDAYQFATSFEL